MGGSCNTMRQRRGVNKVLVRKPEGRNHLEDTGLDGRIILRWIFRSWDVGGWTGSIWLRIGTEGRALVNAVMNFHKMREIS